MKQNYFKTLLSAFVLALCATSASADVQSMTDLFGKYKFTADVEVVDKAYEGTFKNECEVTIATGLNIYVPASIVGIGGGTETQTINKFDATAHTFTCINPNTPSPWGDGLFYSNAEGQNPYGEIQRTLEIVYTFDPATKEISMEDFTVVTLSQQNESGTATIVAKFTNVKLTLEESEEIGIVDLSDVWTFKGSPEKENDAYPSTFTLTLESTSEDFKNYNAKLAFEGYDTITTTATFDGIELSMPYDSICVNGEDSIFLVTYWAPKTKGNFTFTYNIEAANLSLSSGIDFAKRTVTENEEGKKIVEFNSQHSFVSGTLVRPSSEDTFNWVGTYTVKGETMLNEGVTKEYPAEFTFKVDYFNGTYYITEFMGNEVISLNNYLGIPLTIAEDGKSATIKTGTYVEFNYVEDENFTPTSKTARILKDINGGNSPLTLTVDEDGAMSLSAFSIFFVDKLTEGSSPVFEVVYQDIIVTKQEAEDFGWNGGFTVTADIDSIDGGNYPTTFAMEISYDEASNEYRVTNFLGYDIAAMTYGGVLLSIDEETGAATMPLSGNFGNICISGEYPNYIMLGDANGGNSSLTFTVNEDATISISDFALYAFNYDTNTIGKKVAAYSDVVATVVDTAAFDWTGRYLFTILNEETYGYDEYVMEIAEYGGKLYVETFMNYELGSLNDGGLLLTVSSDDVKKASIKLNGGYGGALLTMLENYNYLQLRDSVGGTESLGVTLNNNGTLTIDKFQIVESKYGNGIEPVGEPVAYPSVVAAKGGYTTDIKAPVCDEVASETINLNSNQKVSVYDTAGRKVYTGAANAVNSLPKGLYIVKSASAAVKLNIR